MKLSLDWMNDFVDLSQIPLDEILLKLNTSICEVDHVESYLPHLSSVVVVEVQSIEKHPNADKLSVCKASTGSKTYNIVTGAKNIQVHDRIPLVLPGTQLLGKKIESGELRGIQSEGMFASEQEIGLATESSGVWILPQDAWLGQSLQDYLSLKDTILTIDNKSITHRPDLWSHFGFARELASQFSLPIRFHPLQAPEPAWAGKSELTVTESEQAHSYYALEIKGVQIQPSTSKIRLRLQKCGIRSISNVVDVSNYLLLELGQPTHFFDADKLSSKTFSVDFAEDEESFLLLDDTSPSLSSIVTVIRNGSKSVALAGVMGGKDSSVTDSTKKIIMESAVFPRELVRATIRATGLRTESAIRYEKGLERTTTIPTIYRAIQLLQQNGCPQLKAFSTVGFINEKDRSVVLTTTLEYLNSRLGKAFPFSEIENILNRLGFQFQGATPLPEATVGKITVIVPPYRQNYDVTIPDDLVEEIGRTVGYSHLPKLPLSLDVVTPTPNTLRSLERKLKSLASTCLGANEIFSYSFASPEETKIEGIPETSAIHLANEMPSEHSVLRTSLLPGILKSISQNQDRFESVHVFEIGRTYKKGSTSNPFSSFQFKGKNDTEGVWESRIFSLAKLSDAKPQDIVSVESQFLDFRSEVESLLADLGWKNIAFLPITVPHLHPNANLKLSYASTDLGEIGILHTRITDIYNIKRRVFLFQLDLLVADELYQATSSKSNFKSPSQFPQGKLDLSLVMKKETSTAIFSDSVQKLNIPELDSFWVDSVYQGGNLSEDEKSVTYRFHLLSYDKTFTQDRLGEIQSQLIQSANCMGLAIR